MMNKETIYALDRIRYDMLSNPAHELRQILSKYYEPGTKIIITKDYWKIDKPKEE